MVNFAGDEARWDEQLRESLQARPAPNGFAERVVKAAGERQPVREGEEMRGPAVRRPAVLRWAAAAMLLFCIGGGTWLEHRRQEQIAGERARQQVLLALRIAGNTLQAVQHRVVDQAEEESQ